MDQFERTELLIGEDALEKLKRSKVAVFGVGGVGGFAVEALARSGVGSLDLIDNDTVSLSNLNRQIIALHSTLGQYKVDVLRKRVLDINPDCKVNVYKTFYLPENEDEFDFSKYDYVIDAIDTVAGKIALAMQAEKTGTRIISSMGAGNKLDPAAFEVADIYETSVCPLAKVMRRELKKRGVKSLKVVYSKEQPLKPARGRGGEESACLRTENAGTQETPSNVSCQNVPDGSGELSNNAACRNAADTQTRVPGSAKRQTPGSAAFVPSVAGLIIAGEVIKDLIGEDSGTKSEYCAADAEGSAPEFKIHGVAECRPAAAENSGDVVFAADEENCVPGTAENSVNKMLETDEDRGVDERSGEENYDAYSPECGYELWPGQGVAEADLAGFQKKVEQSIHKTYAKDIWGNFVKAIKTYDLLQEGDRVAVCISGGKDSMLMAKLFQELEKHSIFPFEVKFLVMDPGYSPANRKLLEENARLLGIPVEIHESDIFDSVYNIKSSPCYLCARMRRGHLYNFAREMGCNKIALGHHYDDVIETILMGMLYGAQVQTMMPKLHSTNFEGMELIRPMYLIREEKIKSWAKHNDLHFLQCACKFTQDCAGGGDHESISKRKETKKIIAELKKINPDVENHIFKSVENVNLETVIAYKQNGEKHSFLDTY